MRRLTTLLRDRALEVHLSQAEHDALAILSADPATAVALRYCHLLIDGELTVAGRWGQRRTVHDLRRARDVLARQRDSALRRLELRYDGRLAKVNQPRAAPDYLDARVMRLVSGKRFEKTLTKVLMRRGLPKEAIEKPKSGYWSWLNAIGLAPEPDGKAVAGEVLRLRKLDRRSFIAALIADAQATGSNQSLTHPALVERWTACAGEVEGKLRDAREAAEIELLRAPPGERGAEAIRHLKRAVQAYARGCARSLAAALLVEDLKVRSNRIYREFRVQRLRADCLNQTAAELARDEPDVGEAVSKVCATHRANCPKAKDPHPCFDCAPSLVATVRRKMAKQSAETARAARVERAAAVKEKHREGAGTIARADRADAFVCQDALRRLPTGKAHLIAVTEVRSLAPGLFGYAWLTAGGELRTGTDQCGSLHDGWVQAMCQAVLDLATDTTHLLVSCRDAEAADVVQSVLRTGTVPESMRISIGERARGMLVDVAGYGRRVTVHADTCALEHRGVADAASLVAVALRAAQGIEPTENVRAEADRVSQELMRTASDRLISPSEEDDHARWLTKGGQPDRLVWQAALYRMHLDGGWCGLPDGSLEGCQEGQRIQLRLQHQEHGQAKASSAHEVTLRRRGGQWELHRIRWPRSLLPGVVVAFTWPRGTSLMTARTALLPKPERVDGQEFVHRYEAQVVTREIVPGADQDREVPDLSDASWVLRTLRKLGYLSADGSATLAEEALARNCVELGFPPHRLDGLGTAVDQLLRSGQIRRVAGSLDHEQRPWCPPRAGQLRTDLLRYVPRVEAVDLSARRKAEKEWLSRRSGHWVAGFVRRLPPGAEASLEQIELHREAVRAFELVNPELPEGFTYVRRHHRRR